MFVVLIIAFYAAWGETGDARAPKLRRISGIGSVEEIRDRAVASLK